MTPRWGVRNREARSLKAAMASHFLLPRDQPPSAVATFADTNDEVLLAANIVNRQVTATAVAAGDAGTLLWPFASGGLSKFGADTGFVVVVFHRYVFPF